MPYQYLSKFHLDMVCNHHFRSTYYHTEFYLHRICFLGARRSFRNLMHSSSDHRNMRKDASQDIDLTIEYENGHVLDETGSLYYL